MPKVLHSLNWINWIKGIKKIIWIKSLKKLKKLNVSAQRDPPPQPGLRPDGRSRRQIPAHHSPTAIPPTLLFRMEAPLIRVSE